MAGRVGGEKAFYFIILYQGYLNKAYTFVKISLFGYFSSI